MTTVQVREDAETTETIPPIEAEPTEVNGTHKRGRKPRAAPESEQHNTATSDDVLERIESTVRELNAEETRLEERMDRIRKARRELAGTTSPKALIDYEDVQRELARPSRVTRSSSPKRHRRSAAEIQECVDKVVALVKKSKEGIGAQKIREALGLEAKEMPKILKTAIEAKLLKSKGQKRATVYSAR